MRKIKKWMQKLLYSELMQLGFKDNKINTRLIGSIRLTSESTLGVYMTYMDRTAKVSEHVRKLWGTDVLVVTENGGQ